MGVAAAAAWLGVPTTHSRCPQYAQTLTFFLNVPTQLPVQLPLLLLQLQLLHPAGQKWREVSMGLGACGEEPMQHNPQIYVIMRSDSSNIRLFFFCTRYSNWFIHCVFWSAGLSARQGRVSGVSPFLGH